MGQIAAAQVNLDAAIKSGDAAQISAAGEKFTAVVQSCTPTDPCAAPKAAAQANLDAAVKSGDAARIGAAKDKYSAVVSSCNPPKAKLQSRLRLC